MSRESVLYSVLGKSEILKASTDATEALQMKTSTTSVAVLTKADDGPSRRAGGAKSSADFLSSF